jgi:ABC-type dipeptide/oligopeptide/nickel transport system permease subunit
MLRKLSKNRLALIGFVIIAGMILTAILAPWIVPYDPYQQNLAAELAPPSWKHWLGSDQDGCDILSRIVYGARISLWVALVTVAISLSIGMVVGCIAGYYGGIADQILMRLVDFFLAFPGILMAIGITALFRDPSINIVIFALSITGWVGYARLIRGQILAIKNNLFVEAARALGAKDSRIILVHLIPNILAPIIVEVTFGMARIILAEGGLSFLGLGAPPGTPSWGSMLNTARQYMLVAPHLSIYPGLAIMLVVMGFNFLGDGLRDYLDVKD